MGWIRYSHKLVLEPVCKCPAETLVLLLHDRGDSAKSLEPVARQWAEALPTSAFMIPAGIERHDPRPAGPYEPAEWAEIDLAALRLELLVAQQLKLCRLAADRLVLAGVGDGGTIALHMGLRRGLTHAGVLAFAGKIERSLARVASTNGKVRLVLRTAGQDFGDGFAGEFVGHLARRGIDARGILLPGPALSEEAVHYGGFYLAELAATAHPRSRVDPGR
jgi:predicted esterase